jgi:type VI secretion system protein ImpH
LLDRLKQQQAEAKKVLTDGEGEGDAEKTVGRRRRARAATVENEKTAKTGHVRIRPELSLDYAGSDISRVEEAEDGAIELSTTFMGLYGISSPLPAYYTEELLDDEWDGNTAPRDFLDIIHQHLYPLLFKAWQKYRFAHQTVEQGQAKYWDVLYSLIGLADPEFRNCSQYAQRCLPYLGLLSQRQKSVLGLQTILRDALKFEDLDIEQCVARDVPIPKGQYAQLGLAQVTLGANTTIGQHIHDRMGKAKIRINVSTPEQFQSYLTDSDQLDFIRWLCKFYLVQPLDIDIALTLKTDVVQTTELGGDAWAYLGQDTWLQSAAADGCTSNSDKELVEVMVNT